MTPHQSVTFWAPVAHPIRLIFRGNPFLSLLGDYVVELIVKFGRISKVLTRGGPCQEIHSLAGQAARVMAGFYSSDDDY